MTAAWSGLVVVLLLLVGLVFEVERQFTAATMHAQRWGPALAVAAGVRPVGAAEVLQPGVEKAAAAPVDGDTLWHQAPRFVLLRMALANYGVNIDEAIVAGGQSPDASAFLHVVPPRGEALWLTVPASPVAPALPARLVAAVIVLAALFCALGWLITRRLLRQR